MGGRFAFLIAVTSLITVNSFQPLGRAIKTDQRGVCMRSFCKPVRRPVGLQCSIAKPVGPSTTPIRSPSFLNTAGECAYTGITLTRYMRDVSRENPELRDLEDLISGIQQACKVIRSLVDRACITGMTGYEGGGGSINIQGEEQKKLDVITNDVLSKNLKFTGQVAVIASEEQASPFFNEDAYRQQQRAQGGAAGSGGYVAVNVGHKYVTVFDPLDGSSNVDANIATGTIFGVFEDSGAMCTVRYDEDEDFETETSPEDRAFQREAMCAMETLRPGTSLVCAGYCMYSASCSFVFSIGSGVQGFTYDSNIGEFVLTHPNIRVPNRGKIYSMNEANRWDWDKPLQEYITALQTGEGKSAQRYSSRYIGSLVGDIHRTLLYGGIFGYPADKKSPDGKLRLLYEAAPMAFLLEQAGGLALTGKTRILDLQPQAVHQRVPFLAGSRDDVLEMKSFYDASTDPELIQRCLNRLKGRPDAPLEPRA